MATHAHWNPTFPRKNLYHWLFGINYKTRRSRRLPYLRILRWLFDKPHTLNQQDFMDSKKCCVFPSQLAVSHSRSRLHGISGLVDYEEGDELIRLPCPALTWMKEIYPDRCLTRSWDLNSIFFVASCALTWHGRLLVLLGLFLVWYQGISGTLNCQNTTAAVGWWICHGANRRVLTIACRDRWRFTSFSYELRCGTQMAWCHEDPDFWKPCKAQCIDSDCLRLFQHTEMEHTPIPVPTGYNGIPFIVGQGDCLGCALGVCCNLLGNCVCFYWLSVRLFL